MKSTIVNIVLALLAIVVFNAVAFLPPLDHTEVFWASYACCWVTIVLSFAVSLIASKGASGERILYGFPFFAISCVYLVISAIFNIVCMATSAVAMWIVILVNIILIALLVAMFLASGVTRDYIEGQDQQKRADTSFMVALRSQTEYLLSASARTSVEPKARALCDAVRYSDPVSNPALSNMDDLVMNLVNQAINALNAGNEQAAQYNIDQAMFQLEQRNRLLRSYK